MLENNSSERTGYDMRLEYYEAIGELIRAINAFVSTGDYNTWYRAIMQLVNLHPFLTEAEQASCDAALLTAKNYLRIADVAPKNPVSRAQVSYFRAQAEKQLNTVTRVIVKAYDRYDMLLPKKQNNNDELSDSGLSSEMGL